MIVSEKLVDKKVWVNIKLCSDLLMLRIFDATHSLVFALYSNWFCKQNCECSGRSNLSKYYKIITNHYFIFLQNLVVDLKHD